METAVYKKYGKLVRGAKQLCAVCHSKKQRKAINASLREADFNEATLCNMMAGKYVEDDAIDLYVAVICFYLQLVIDKLEMDPEEWKDMEVSWERACHIVEKLDGSYAEYNHLLNGLSNLVGINLERKALMSGNDYELGEVVIVNGRKMRKVYKKGHKKSLSEYAQLIVDHSDIIGSRHETFLNKVDISEEKFQMIEHGKCDDIPIIRRILGQMVRYAVSKYGINPSSVPLYFPDKRIIDMLMEGKGEAQLYESFFSAVERFRDEKKEEGTKTYGSHSQNTRKEYGSPVKPIRIGRN